MRLIGIILGILVFVGLVFYVLWSLDILKGSQVLDSQGSEVEDLSNIENQGGLIDAAKNSPEYTSKSLPPQSWRMTIEKNTVPTMCSKDWAGKNPSLPPDIIAAQIYPTGLLCE